MHHDSDLAASGTPVKSEYVGFCTVLLRQNGGLKVAGLNKSHQLALSNLAAGSESFAVSRLVGSVRLEMNCLCTNKQEGLLIRLGEGEIDQGWP